MRSFGAELVLTDPAKGMGGTVKKAYDLLESTPDAHMLQQFDNPEKTQVLKKFLYIYIYIYFFFFCIFTFYLKLMLGILVQIHFDTTGPEIWEDTLGNVDIFVMGIGSGGTVSGVGQYLKSKNPNVKVINLISEDIL